MNPTLKTIHNLSSAHHGFIQGVPEEDLKVILSACMRAPNASNRQRYSIIVLNDPVVIKNLALCKAQTALVFCVDSNRIMDTAKIMGLTYTLGDVSPLITGITDTALAAQTAAIAATSMGHDVLFSTRMFRNIDAIYTTLKLPEEHCFPLVMLLLGKEKRPFPYKKGRVSGPGIIHYGTYKRANEQQLHQLVEQYDDPTMGINPKWKEMGYEHYLTWFFNKWTAKSDRKEHHSRMYEVLKRSKYLE